jgi:hypothetical protein
MLNISRETKLSPDKIKEKAKIFFGGKSVKLELSEELDNCLTFTGGGGYVTVAISPAKGKSQVEITTTEWEFQAKEFLTEI